MVWFGYRTEGHFERALVCISVQNPEKDKSAKDKFNHTTGQFGRALICAQKGPPKNHQGRANHVTWWINHVHLSLSCSLLGPA